MNLLLLKNLNHWQKIFMHRSIQEKWKFSYVFEADDPALGAEVCTRQALPMTRQTASALILKLFRRPCSRTPTDFLVPARTETQPWRFWKETFWVPSILSNQENLGEIIANPSITVRTGELGKIQIGSTFSIKQRDFANVTRSILFNRLYYWCNTSCLGRMESIMLCWDLLLRSTTFPSELSTEIRKTKANSHSFMLNGKETVIGGLYVTDETYVRTGIPILKDLPWWVFGIRYLAGANQKKITKKEIIIVIKT